MEQTESFSCITKIGHIQKDNKRFQNPCCALIYGASPYSPKSFLIQSIFRVKPFYYFILSKIKLPVNCKNNKKKSSPTPMMMDRGDTIGTAQTVSWVHDKMNTQTLSDMRRWYEYMSEMRKRSAGRDPDLSGVRQSGYRTGSAGDPEYPETASGSAAGTARKRSILRDPGEPEKNPPADRGGCGDRIHCVVHQIIRNED